EDDSPRLNPNQPPGPAPEGMVWVPGGEFYMGDEQFSDARPVRKVYVDGFWMDRTEVTNAQFAKFVQATGYKTVAERRPDPEHFPNLPPEIRSNLKPFSMVFAAPDRDADRCDPRAYWHAVPGADWRHPEGPQSDLKGRENHPVVHVCWHDAAAYAIWA